MKSVILLRVNRLSISLRRGPCSSACHATDTHFIHVKHLSPYHIIDDQRGLRQSPAERYEGGLQRDSRWLKRGVSSIAGVEFYRGDGCDRSNIV